MKKVIYLVLIALLSLASATLYGQQRGMAGPTMTVVNPTVDTPGPDGYQIMGIQVTDTLTRVYMYVAAPEAMPGRSKVYFAPSTCLRDSATGDRYYIKSLQGGDIDTDIYMSNDSQRLFVLTFQPLKKSVEKVDYVNNRIIIGGVSLSESAGQFTATPGQGR